MELGAMKFLLFANILLSIHHIGTSQNVACDPQVDPNCQKTIKKEEQLPKEDTICVEGVDCPESTTEEPPKQGRSKRRVPCEYRCANRYQCIEWKAVCDDVVDCHDVSDELLDVCKHRYTTGKCKNTEFECMSDKGCINIHKVCDNEIDCEDGSDEELCDDTRHKRLVLRKTFPKFDRLPLLSVKSRPRKQEELVKSLPEDMKKKAESHEPSIKSSSSIPLDEYLKEKLPFLGDFKIKASCLIPLAQNLKGKMPLSSDEFSTTNPSPLEESEEKVQSSTKRARHNFLLLKHFMKQLTDIFENKLQGC